MVDTTKMMYLEIIRPEMYKKWKKNPNYVPKELIKKYEQEDMKKHESIGQQHRFQISHLNENLKAWRAAVANLPAGRRLYSLADVNNMPRTQCNSSPQKFQYVLDDLTWECDYFVKEWVSQQGNVKKTLVIHMPNDGYFYINEILMENFLGLKVARSNMPKKTVPNENWSILDKTVWDQLAPFKSFMTDWFGASLVPHRMQSLVMYHADANRIDLCMRHQDTHVSIEFSFEPSYPIALEDDWFTTL